jgi:DNA-directed RNA polymerase subunit beta'
VTARGPVTGPVNPHDILRIKGPRVVHGDLPSAVVEINDKHIVRQMLQKVRILDSEDSQFLEGENVDKRALRDANELAKKKKLKTATAEPLLLGITKASPTTQSFVLAASFRERRGCSPTRRFVARRTRSSASRRTSSSVT